MSTVVIVKVDALGVLQGLHNAEKRMDYALVNALNVTAKAVQAAEVAGLRGKFSVRKPVFVKRQVAIINFANVKQGRLQASISVGVKPRLLLGDLEVGGTRRPFKGKRVAVPVEGGPARPTFTMPVQDAFTFKSLRLIGKVGGTGARKDRSRGRGRVVRNRSSFTEGDVSFVSVKTKGKERQYKGTHRTFILHHTARAPEGGVYQRIGPKKGDIRLVYSFKSAPHLRAMLNWLPTAKRAVDKTFEVELGKQVAETLKHAFANAAKLGAGFIA